MEQMELNQFVIQGESNVHILTPGYRFDLTRNGDADGSYVLTSAEHTAYEGGFQSEDDIGRNNYANKFDAIPFDLAYRPARTAEKPHVWGCQTAVVVGPSGEEIYVDKYGRVKVHFHWDRENRRDQSSSCWIRVATLWSGQNWGTIHLPRVGQEVVVDFLEGDPDRPIIMGSVYNAANMPPYTLPANKTQSGIITESSQGGNGYNQIRFEDKKGSEEVRIHAQKDMNTTVENNETLEVKKDRKITVKADNQTTVGNNMNLTVQADRTTKIDGKDALTVQKDSSATVLGSESRTIAKSRTAKIASSDTLTVGGSISITAGGGLTITAPKITLNAAMVQVSGVVQCANLIASAGVVSPVYSPGAGNMM
jgi:type VI secretion system secreted protein VgrG